MATDQTSKCPAKDFSLDAVWTENIVQSMGPNTNPRLREVMSSLIRHIHDFAREVDLRVGEWLAGVKFVNEAGQVSDEKRNEGQLLCDVIGVESLVDAITYENATGSTGYYEQQDDGQVEHNLRGQFVTDSQGGYAFYCIKPTPYPVPGNGPGGKLLKLMDRQIYRPAHIHLMVRKEGYQPVTTQIYDADSEFLDNDSVFAVKDSLVVKFVPRADDAQASLELSYEIQLAKKTKTRL